MFDSEVSDALMMSLMTPRDPIASYTYQSPLSMGEIGADTNESAANKALINAGLAMLAANKPGASTGEVVGKGGLVGMNTYQSLIDKALKQRMLDATMQRQAHREDLATAAQNRLTDVMQIKAAGELRRQNKEEFGMKSEIGKAIEDAQKVAKALGEDHPLVQKMYEAIDAKGGGKLTIVTPGSTVLDRSGKIIFQAPPKPEKADHFSDNLYKTASKGYNADMKALEAEAGKGLMPSEEYNRRMLDLMKRWNPMFQMSGSPGFSEEDLQPSYNYDKATNAYIKKEKTATPTTVASVPTKAKKIAVRTGTEKGTGRKVVQYSDGTTDYAD